jgi:hypothetical protein
MVAQLAHNRHCRRGYRCDCRVGYCESSQIVRPYTFQIRLMTHYQRLRFDLKFIFLAMSNACVLAWGTAAILHNGDIVALPVMVIFASLTYAWYGLTRGRHPVVSGAIGGFVGAAIIALSYCALHGIGYLFCTAPDEYFEDGAFVELVVFPPVYVVVWGGFGAVVGTSCGALVWVFKTGSSPARVKPVSNA